MSDTSTETTTPPTEPTPSTDKRERRAFPIRLLSEPGIGWALVPVLEFTTIEAAEKWIAASGAPGVAYMMARVIGAKRRPPAKLEDVAI